MNKGSIVFVSSFNGRENSVVYLLDTAEIFQGAFIPKVALSTFVTVSSNNILVKCVLKICLLLYAGNTFNENPSNL